MAEAWLAAFASSPFLLPLLYLLVVGDAFLVVLPSESVVVALAALSVATGQPSLLLVVPVAAAGAVTGDFLCFMIGRRVGLDRWRWQRRGWIALAIARARRTILTRTAVLIITARYVPFARIAVNLTAGSAGVPVRRFLPLSAAAGTGWALYNTAIGAFFGAILPTAPIVAIVCSIIVAVGVGLVIDAVINRRAARLARDTAAETVPQE
jgi:membrane-associated protein